ncbi:MAG: hypothetical protein PHS97_06515 [Oscillospiraceae bacterium]|nr:hypothetical protein [Oscillospiraceae bacterium]
MENKELPKFRSSLNGFNRDDVVGYIELLSKKNTTAVKSLQDENHALQAQVEQFRSALQSAQTLIEELSDEPEAPVPCEALPASESPAAAEVPAPQEDCAAPRDNAAQDELAAYRRAEAAERSARSRANAVTRKIDSVLTEALSRFASTGSEADALCEDLNASISRLQDALAEIRVIYEEASDKLQELNDLTAVGIEE